MIPGSKANMLGKMTEAYDDNLKDIGAIDQMNC